jgi:hypothetical protein
MFNHSKEEVFKKPKKNSSQYIVSSAMWQAAALVNEKSL